MHADQEPQPKGAKITSTDGPAPETYFVTLFTLEQKVFLGHVVDSRMDANICGSTVRDVWLELERIYPHVRLDHYTILPHYLQGLVMLVPRKGAQASVPTIDEVIADFKNRTQQRINQLFRPTALTLWEDRHTIERVTTASELDALRMHIQESPSRWTSAKVQPAGEWLTGFIDRLASSSVSESIEENPPPTRPRN